MIIPKTIPGLSQHKILTAVKVKVAAEILIFGQTNASKNVL